MPMPVFIWEQESTSKYIHTFLADKIKPPEKSFSEFLRQEHLLPLPVCTGNQGLAYKVKFWY